MNKFSNLLGAFLLFSAVINGQNQHRPDTIGVSNSYDLDEVIVTGSRVAISRDVMPVPVSIVSRNTLEQSGETNLLPALSRQVPSLFVTTRGMAGMEFPVERQGESACVVSPEGRVVY